MAARLRCLFIERDDLHDYALEVFARMAELTRSKPMIESDFDTVQSKVLHRAGRYQTELYEIDPHTVVKLHTHPRVDSIEIMGHGDLEFQVGGVLVGRDYDRARRSAFFQGKGVRVNAEVPHGFTAGPEGVSFLSCQRWDTEPLDSIGLRWQGKPHSAAHERMLDALAAVA